MITLFRRIRQKLIDSGSVPKYLLYATGEILLVVIGILIALQVNNWNEDRILQNELNSYLTKKMDNLYEDQRKLQDLREYREEASALCANVLESGVLNIPGIELVDTVLLITVERRFISSVQNEQSAESNSYFNNIKEAQIVDLETEYQNLINLITFDETRLNNFSENMEADLWRNGFFNDNRELFIYVENAIGDPEDIVISDATGLKSLEAILRRNEITNLRLADRYSDALNLNQLLVAAIENYLNSQ
ncbi:DUF6090 family protein [Rhodohalobacter mucosus]|uniref:Uncharacterized protein n=1 Tax=Rhodohalobacter mucosus TaxID=2079485 RepID=A0A316TQH9_9BACT|nr:DUF6090 family protein [Rhodohalobacter mucosus]PWN05489.1 hypothetical protein DDZ15_12840 [Rhodohalobacter mucosus]